MTLTTPNVTWERPRFLHPNNQSLSQPEAYALTLTRQPPTPYPLPLPYPSFPTPHPPYPPHPSPPAPQSNPTGYERSSVMAHVDKIEGSLLLVHGLIDENVHFRHTARLINALIRSQKHYELLLFPDERHSPRSLQDRIFMEQRIHSFIQRTLGTV
jgi:hypothetical protein